MRSPIAPESHKIKFFQNVASSYKKVLFGNKKEWGIQRFYNMNEPWKHCDYTKWKVRKHYILYDTVYIKMSGITKHRDRTWMNAQGRGDGNIQVSFCDDENVLKLDGCTTP